jgi:hypothetical protein
VVEKVAAQEAREPPLLQVFEEAALLAALHPMARFNMLAEVVVRGNFVLNTQQQSVQLKL